MQRHRIRNGPRTSCLLWLACLLLTLAITSACSRHAPLQPMRVTVELFTIAFDAEGLSYWRDTQQLTRSTGAPENAVLTLLAKRSNHPKDSAPETSLIHSTSWRHEDPGQIVLTYLACTRLDAGRLPGATRVLADDIPGQKPTDPLQPRPARILEQDVLAHGLRHLAFLMQREPEGAVAHALNPAGRMMLWRLSPTVAGQLPANQQ